MPCVSHSTFGRLSQRSVNCRDRVRFGIEAEFLQHVRPRPCSHRRGGRRVAHLKANGVAIEEGPVAKQGARGTLRSVYCRDPDGSLIEISSYAADVA